MYIRPVVSERVDDCLKDKREKRIGSENGLKIERKNVKVFLALKMSIVYLLSRRSRAAKIFEKTLMCVSELKFQISK